MKTKILAAFLLLASLGSFADETADGQKACDELGWQLAVHAYTFKAFPIAEAIKKTAALGLKYMSLSGGLNMDGKRSVTTVNLTDEELKTILAEVKDAGLTLVNIGVVDLPPDEAKSRKVFEFAKKAGIDTLVAEPKPEALDVVEKLCKEYNIKVAIHDHPRPSHYWNPDTVLEAVKGRTPLMGACADVGHWKRSGLDPVECLKKLEGRIIVLHFKDLVPNEPKLGPDGKPVAEKPGAARSMHDVPWGTGESNVKGMMAELKRQHFHGAFCVEYEYHWENSSPEIAQCIKYFNATAAELVK